MTGDQRPAPDGPVPPGAGPVPAGAEPVPPDAGRPIAPHHSRFRETVGVLFQNRLSLFGALVLGLLAVAAVLSALVTPYDPTGIDMPNRLQSPSWSHPFGTDNLGRDVFSRVLAGTRVSLQVGLIAVGISLTAGVTVGLASGFYAGATDSVLMRTMDVLFAFPAILLAIAVLAVLGPGITNAMIAIGIVYTPIFARITRASTLVVKEELFVRAARSVGASDLRILARHILPSILAPIIVQTSLSLAFAILAEAALSFLGLGVQPPDPAWGRMLAEGRAFVGLAPWMGIFPGLAIFLTVLAFNFIGDGLRDALDPRQRSIIESRGREV